MAKKLYFIILGDKSNQVKQLQISRPALLVSAFVCAIGLTLLGFGLYDYITINYEIARTHSVEKELEIQTDEVIHQRRQIQKFATEINLLKDRLLELSEFEKQIRLIANINGDEIQTDLLGVGGSAPEDLNVDLELQERHNQLIKDMHNQIKKLEDTSATQKSVFSKLLKDLKEQKNIMAHTPAIRPTEGWISSGFGYRKSPFTGKREFHKGVDIANRKGTPILAPAEGTVSFVGKKGSFGNLIVIDHGYGIITRYAHIEKITCKRGDIVQRGDVIAQMGNSGRSTGPHLHYEVRLNGVPVNPSKYILD